MFRFDCRLFRFFRIRVVGLVQPLRRIDRTTFQSSGMDWMFPLDDGVFRRCNDRAILCHLVGEEKG